MQSSQLRIFIFLLLWALSGCNCPGSPTIPVPFPPSLPPSTPSINCSVFSQCPGNQTCFEGRCQAGCTQGSCGDGQSCLPNRSCGCGSTCQCERGFRCGYVEQTRRCVQGFSPHESGRLLLFPRRILWLAPGAKRRYSTVFLDAFGTRMWGAPKAPPRWSSKSPEVASVHAETGEITPGKASGWAEITASTDGKHSPVATVYVPPQLQDKSQRIFVTDPQGTPLAQVQVRWGTREATTDVSGTALFQADAPFSGDIHLFHPKYHYLSLFGAQGRQFYFQLQPNQNQAPMGGVTGEFDFSKLALFSPKFAPKPNTLTLSFGLSGVSYKGSWIEYSIHDFLGPQAPELLDGSQVLFPQGLSSSVAENKTRFAAAAPSGPRDIWAFGNFAERQPLQRLGLTRGADHLDKWKNLAIVFGDPSVRDTFGYALKSHLSFALHPPILDRGDLNKNGNLQEYLPNFLKLLKSNLRFDTPLSETYTAPMQFQYPYENWLRLAILGVLREDTGFTPVGFVLSPHSGQNETLSIRHAPLCGALSEGQMVLLRISSMLPSQAGQIERSYLYIHHFAHKDRALPPPKTERFTEYKEHAFQTKTNALTLGSKEQFDGFQKFVFSSKNGHKWIVWTTHQETITLPSPPKGQTDPLKELHHIERFALQLKKDTDLESIFQFNTQNMDQLNKWIVGVSKQIVQRE